MSYKDKLDNCLVSLDVGEKNALFIVLMKDGTICRRGNGNPDKEFELLKGYSELQHYQAFMMTVSEDLFQFSGLFEQHPIVGRPCKMMIVFSGPDGEEAGFKVNYGEDSQGPPREIVEMLINAVKLTDPWYEKEREKIHRQAEKSPPKPAPTSTHDKTPAIKPNVVNAITHDIKPITNQADATKPWWKVW